MSKFEENLDTISERVFTTVISKNKSYGNSVGKAASMMHILYGREIGAAHYNTLHFVIRILDKLSRLTSGTIDLTAERDAWMDIQGYALIAATQVNVED